MGYPLRRFILAFVADFFFFAWRCCHTCLFIPLFCFVFFPLFCAILSCLDFFCTLLPLLTRCSLQCNTFTFGWWRSIHHIPFIRCCVTALRHVRADERTASSYRNANHSVFLNYAKSSRLYSKSKSTNGLLASRIGRMERTASLPMSNYLSGFS